MAEQVNSITIEGYHYATEDECYSITTNRGCITLKAADFVRLRAIINDFFLNEYAAVRWERPCPP